jgi:hypothetical protein
VLGLWPALQPPASSVRVSVSTVSVCDTLCFASFFFCVPFPLSLFSIPFSQRFPPPVKFLSYFRNGVDTLTLIDYIWRSMRAGCELLFDIIVCEERPVTIKISHQGSIVHGKWPCIMFYNTSEPAKQPQAFCLALALPETRDDETTRPAVRPAVRDACATRYLLVKVRAMHRNRMTESEKGYDRR